MQLEWACVLAKGAYRAHICCKGYYLFSFRTKYLLTSIVIELPHSQL